MEYLIKNDIIKIPLIERLEDENTALKKEIIQLQNKDSPKTQADSSPSFTTPNTKDSDSFRNQISIVTVEGSAVPGCEETANGCYIPNIVKSNLGDIIVMSNTDVAAHTYTSGNPSAGSDGTFDSGLISPGHHLNGHQTP